MDWTQFTIFFLGNVVFTLTLWLWSRAEARSDHRQVQDLIERIRADGKEFREMWMNESKEFHGRLCAIEEKNRK